MFRITLIFGKKLKKLLVYSHASVIKVSECPTRIFPPIAGRIPPTLMVGSHHLQKNMGNHGSSRGFSVGSGNCDRCIVVAHDLTKKLCSVSIGIPFSFAQANSGLSG